MRRGIRARRCTPAAAGLARANLLTCCWPPLFDGNAAAAPLFFSGVECAMGWGKRKEEVDGTLVREDFDFIWMYGRNGERKLCERKGKRKEGGKGGRVAWKIILIREKLKRDYEVERRIGTGTSRLSRHVYHIVFLFLFKS